MVVSCLPQTAYTVYAAEDIAIDSEIIDEEETGEIEIVQEEEVFEEEIPEQEISEEVTLEEVISDDEIPETEEIIPETEELQAEETEVTDEDLNLADNEPTITFDATGGQMNSKDYKAVSSVPADSMPYTSQTFAYAGNETDGYSVVIDSFDNIVPIKQYYGFDGWIDGNGNPLPDKFDTKESRTYYVKWKELDPVVSFVATGGTMANLDPNAIAYEGTEGSYTYQAFNYYDKGKGEYGIGIKYPIENITPSKSGYKFYGWFDSDGNKVFSSPYTEKKNITYYARWIKELGDAPTLVDDYGQHEGIRLFNDTNSRVCFSFKVDKSDYNNIEIGEDEALRLYYSYGATAPISRNNQKDGDGYYSVWNGELIDPVAENTEVPTAFKDYDYLFAPDKIPTKKVNVRFYLKYVLVKKDASGGTGIMGDWSNVVGESEAKEIKFEYAPFVSSVSLKNKAVLSPAIGGAEVTSAIKVNAGADVKNLDFKFVNSMPEVPGEEGGAGPIPDYVKVSLSNGNLKVQALPGWKFNSEGNPEDVHPEEVFILIYDKSNETLCTNQPINGNMIKIVAQPTWKNKTPSASLTSATDIALNFKVTAPSGIKFDGNYYAAVNLVPTVKTKLSEEITLNDKTKYVQINDDGTIPEVSINAFCDKAGGDEIDKLGKGLGTSMTAKVCIVRADGNPNNGGTILATSSSKTLTVSTKTPYYADKITLKKGTTNLYAGDRDVIVATVDFGKNTTYTRAEDWEIENAEELKKANIIVEKDGNNRIKVTAEKGEKKVKAGTYTIKVATKAGDGVPAKASINIKVLPTESYIEIDPVKIYYIPGKALNYTLNVTIKSQDEEIIKKPALNYEIGKDNSGIIEPIEGLSISKGKIKIDKSFKFEDDIWIKISSQRDSRYFSYCYVSMIEDPVKPADFEFPDNGGKKIEDGSEMTLNEFLNLGWNKDYLELNDRGAILGLDDLYSDFYSRYSGIAIMDEGDNIVNEDMLKSINIPNPLYIKKTGKVTFTATAIDGTKLTKTITIVPDDIDFGNDIYIQGQSKIKETTCVAKDDTLDASGESTGAIYTVWLKKDDNVSTDKDYISGETLTVKGGKIVENIHNDYIKFVMTGKEATITRKKGKTIIGTYKITNDSFNLATPKVTAEKDKKIYTDFGDTQYITYTFNKDFGDAATKIKVESSNDSFSNYFSGADFEKINGKSWKFYLASYKINNLKAGSYSFTIELFDNEGNSLCKPAKATLKVEKLKKSFKFVAKYTMSVMDATQVRLEATGVNYSHIPYAKDITLFNANTKGHYNNFTEIFEVCDIALRPYIKIRDGKYLPSGKSITGYIGYTVQFKDGSSEYHLEKITINIVKQAYKYTVDDTEKYWKDWVWLTVRCSNDPNNPIKISKAAVDKKSESLVDDISVEREVISFSLNTEKITKAGTYTIKFNVIPATSPYAGQDVTPDNSIPITVKVKVSLQ